jgi:hypothetical protein
VAIPTAACAHIMKGEVADPLAEYRRINVDRTFNLLAKLQSLLLNDLSFLVQLKLTANKHLFVNPTL